MNFKNCRNASNMYLTDGVISYLRIKMTNNGSKIQVGKMNQEGLQWIDVPEVTEEEVDFISHSEIATRASKAIKELGMASS